MNYNNYFLKSTGNWKPCKKPKRKPSYVSYKRTFTYNNEIINSPYFKHSLEDYGGCKRFYYEDKRLGISSRYWYGEDSRGKYIIRESDHWGKVASCHWYKKYDTINKKENALICAKIYLNELKNN